MMKKIISFLLLMGMLLLAACGRKEKKEDVNMQETIFSAAGTVTLYHVQGSDVEPDEERYQLKQPDSLSASVEEVALAISLPEGVTFDSYSIDIKQVIHLTLVVSENVSQETRLLSKVAIVRSMNGLQDAKDYVIQLVTEEGDLLEEAPYSEDSFYYYETGD